MTCNSRITDIRQHKTKAGASFPMTDYLSSHVNCAYYTVAPKNVLALTSCSFEKHRLILIILAKQHQHTFKNYVHSTFFYLLCLLSNSCSGNDTKRNGFSSVGSWWLSRAGCVRRTVVALKRASFSISDVQSDIFSPSHLHITAVSTDPQLRHRMAFCDMLAHMSVRTAPLLTMCRRELKTVLFRSSFDDDYAIMIVLHSITVVCPQLLTVDATVLLFVLSCLILYGAPAMFLT